jgi:hypothetical protein
MEAPSTESGGLEMTESSAALFGAAQKLDETPMAMLNGGASDALSALNAAAPEVQIVARTRDIDVAVVNELWERAEARLREAPEPDAVFEAAAEAASLLYVAAWVFGSESATTDDLRDLL